MSYNNIIPAWVFRLPLDVPDKERLEYFETKAEKDGVPLHVIRLNLEMLRKKL